MNALTDAINGLDESRQRDLLYRSRRQLASLSNSVTATPGRKDWLLHMTQQAFSLDEILLVVNEFNELQLKSNLAIIEVVPHELGLHFSTR